MKILARLLLLALLLLPAGALFGLFTESGTRSLLTFAHRLPLLQIDYASGTLAGQLKIRKLVLSTTGMQLTLTDLLVELDRTCLWRSALCFRQLQAAGLDITLLAKAAEEERVAAAVSAPVVFPFVLETAALDLGSLRVDWGSGQWRQGQTRGQVRLEGSTIEVIRAEIDRAHLELRPGESDQAGDSARVLLPAINLPLELRVQQLDLGRPSFKAFGGERELQRIALQGAWVKTRLSVTRLDIADTVLGSLAVGGTLDFSGTWPLELTLQGAVAQPPFWEGLYGRDFSVGATGSLADLAIDFSAPGEPGLRLAAWADLLDRQLPFSVNLTAEGRDDIALADVYAMPEMLSDAQLGFPLSATVAGDRQRQQIDLDATFSALGYDALHVIASAGQVHGELNLDFLNMREANGDNDLQLSGKISLGAPLQWDMQLQTTGLTLPPVNASIAGRLAGGMQSRGNLAPEHWEVYVSEVDLSGEVNELPAKISGFAGIVSGLQLAASELQAELNGAQLLLQASGDAADPARFDFSVAQLADWLPGASGSVQAQVLRSADGERMDVSGFAEDFKWNQVQFSRATIAGNYLALTDASHSLDLKFDDVVIGTVQLSALQLSSSGTAQQHELALNSKGDVGTALTIDGSLEADNWRGTLAPNTVATPIGDWILADRVTLSGSPSEQALTLSKHCWAHSLADLCIGASRVGREGATSVDLNTEVGLLAGQLPPDISMQGRVQLLAKVTWGDSGVSASGNVATHSILLTHSPAEEDSASFGWEQAEGTFSFDEHGLDMLWQVQREGRKAMDLALKLPRERAAPIAGHVEIAELELAALAGFVPALSVLEGSLGGSLLLGGTIDQPLAYGTLQLADGRLALRGNPTELAELQLQLDLQGQRAQLQGQAMLGDGNLDLSGELLLHPHLQLALALEGERHQILYPPSAQAVVSEQLKVTYSEGLVAVVGAINVHEGVLEIEQLPEGGVAISSDVVEVDLDGNVLREEVPLDMRLDIQVVIEDHFVVTGDLLETTLGGQLHLRQKPGQPLRLFGNLETLGGELRAYRQRLAIKRGTVSFTGSAGNPSVDVQAERDISSENVTAGVRVRGRLQDELELELYSDPAMSQGDTMSYLVRGRGLDAGAGADGTALALSLATGVVNKSTLVSELNRIPGISNIEFGAQGSEESTAATVSGYVGERIYLSYGVGLYEPINVMTARLYLRPRLWLEVLSSLENSVDLYYSFDRD